jgi:type III secretion protein R
MGFDVGSGLITILVVGLIPFAAVMATSFTKIVIVFALLKNAMGIPQIPPAMVTNGLALILTAFIMAPVLDKLAPAVNSTPGKQVAIDPAKAFADAREPMREFLAKHTTDDQREFFMTSATRIWPQSMREGLKNDHLLILLPSFTLSEINKAFKIGFLIYLVFVIIDLVVANVLLALGMSMMQPTMVSAPLKLLLFLAVDGWTRLVQLLVLSYQ